MLSAVFDRVADIRAPIWVIAALGLFYFSIWQTFLPRVEAAELTTQIDNITLEIRLRSAQDNVNRLEALLWALDTDPNTAIPGTPSNIRKSEIAQRKGAADRYHNCLVNAIQQMDSSRAKIIESCEKLNRQQ